MEKNERESETLNMAMAAEISDAMEKERKKDRRKP
jgi:hypothetical protein